MFFIFLWFWLGGFIAPVPNEVMILTISSTNNNEAYPVLLFIVIFCGLIAGNTTCYLVGRYFGSYILSRLNQTKYFHTAKSLLDIFNEKVLLVTYFMPGIRNAAAVICGTKRLPFARYAIYSYSSIFIWAVLYFTLGQLVPNPVVLWEKVDGVPLLAGTIILVCFALVKIYLPRRKSVELISNPRH
ncbi:DedA family protein [Alkalihalobacterium elongatum]|uniref:DedA family protein n=1 Tax=Alkalihalobacterium elongatum TaxID=2675466 RepID=UPI001C1FBF21|nr:VTT domain-containing protein [Alkalihalobacterium elongatum]